MKVLVADDSDILRRGLLGFFSDLEGIEVVGQVHAEPEALRVMSIYKPDALVLDIQIILGRGIALLRKIKHEYPSMVVIILTNFIALPYRNKCLEAGADFFLDKSTEIGRLKGIIQSLSDQLSSKGRGPTVGINGVNP